MECSEKSENISLVRQPSRNSNDQDINLYLMEIGNTCKDKIISRDDSSGKISNNSLLNVNSEIWRENKTPEDSEDFSQKFNELKKKKSKFFLQNNKKKFRNFEFQAAVNLELTQCSTNRESYHEENIVNLRRFSHCYRRLSTGLNSNNSMPRRCSDVQQDSQLINRVSTKTIDFKIGLKKYEAKNNNITFVINLQRVFLGKDRRTTLMVRNVPNKYTLKLLLEEINEDFRGKYDVFYLPVDFKSNKNLGFCFINLVDSMQVISFYETFNGRRWKMFNSGKICNLSYSKFQGKDKLIAHYEKSSILRIQDREKKPIVFPVESPLPDVEFQLVKYI